MIQAISKSNGVIFVQPLKIETTLNLIGDMSGFNEAVFGRVLVADVRNEVIKEGDVVVYLRSSENETTMNGTSMYYVPTVHVLAIAKSDYKYVNRR